MKIYPVLALFSVFFLAHSEEVQPAAEAVVEAAEVAAVEPAGELEASSPENTESAGKKEKKNRRKEPKSEDSDDESSDSDL